VGVEPWRQRYPEALRCYSLEIEALRNIAGWNSSANASALRCVVDMHMAQKDYDSALVKCEQALIQLANIYRAQQNYQSACINYEQALQITVRYVGEYTADAGLILDSLGAVCAKLELFEEGLQHLTRACEVRNSVHGENSEEVSKTLNNIGLLWERQGRQDQAYTNYSAALSILSCMHDVDTPEMVEVRNNMKRATQCH